MDEILVLSREKIEKYNFDGRTFAIISITDPKSNLAKISYDENKILRLQFHDVDKDVVIDNYIPLGVNYIKSGKIEIKSINANQASQVVDFVFENSGVDTFIVHCEAGISRSAGVAGAISKFIFGDDNFYFQKYLPNRKCHQMVLEEFHNRPNKLGVII